MNVYVLNGIKNEVLECVEVYNSLDGALEDAKVLAKKWGVYPQHVFQRRVPSMDAVVVVDIAREAQHVYSDPVFITVVGRDIELPNHNTIGQAIFGKPIHPPLTTLPLPAITPSNVDDPTDLGLPGGFDFNDKPLFMKDIKDGDDFKQDYQLTEEQKWALVTARIAKRPLFIWHNLLTRATCDQQQALQELKTRSPAGVGLRNEEIYVLQNWYEEILGDEESSSSSDSYG